MLCHTVLHSLPALVKHFATPLLYTLPHLAIPGYTLCHTLYNFATPYTAHHPWWNTLPHLITHFATSCDTACHHWRHSLPYLITHFATLSHFAKPSYIACHPSLHTLPHLIIHFAIPRYTLCHTLLHALQTPCYTLCKYPVTHFAFFIKKHCNNPLQVAKADHWPDSEFMEWLGCWPLFYCIESQPVKDGRSSCHKTGILTV